MDNGVHGINDEYSHKAVKRRTVRRLERLGYQVILIPAPTMAM